MIPSANRESRERLPPEKRLRKPRMFEPPTLSRPSFTALASTPGEGM
jgi:hypothetical protein